MAKRAVAFVMKTQCICHQGERWPTSFIRNASTKDRLHISNFTARWLNLLCPAAVWKTTHAMYRMKSDHDCKSFVVFLSRILKSAVVRFSLCDLQSLYTSYNTLLFKTWTIYLFKTGIFFLLFSFQSHPPELFTAVTKNLKLSAYHDSLIDHIVVFVEVRKNCSINSSENGNPAVVSVILLQKALTI